MYAWARHAAVTAPPKARRAADVSPLFQPAVGSPNPSEVPSASRQLRVFIDFSHACSDSTWALLNTTQGKTYNDDRLMFTIELTGL